MKIAIIGAGFFGITAGLILSNKHQVDIFEKEKKILNGASHSNQFRFHLGYHYPRSQKTVNEIKKSKNLFVSFFGNKVFGKTYNYYSIAVNSKLNFREYKKFLLKNNLYFKIIKNLLNNKFIENTIKSNERILNYFKIRNDILDKII